MQCNSNATLLQQQCHSVEENAERSDRAEDGFVRVQLLRHVIRVYAVSLTAAMAITYQGPRNIAHPSCSLSRGENTEIRLTVLPRPSFRPPPPAQRICTAATRTLRLRLTTATRYRTLELVLDLVRNLPRHLRTQLRAVRLPAQSLRHRRSDDLLDDRRLEPAPSSVVLNM